MNKIMIFPIVLLAMAGCNSKPQTSLNGKSEVVTENSDSQLLSSIDKVGIVTDSCDSQQISSADKLEMVKIIRSVVDFDLNNTIDIDLLPAIADEKDSIYIGFDFQKLEITAQQLRNTGFFSETFIDNYKRIITDLDKRLRNNELGVWDMRDMPPFGFAAGYGPFCNCQDDYTIDSISFKIGNYENVEAEWFPKWPDFEGNIQSYGTCKFEKEGGCWKISYLSGFDY